MIKTITLSGGEVSVELDGAHAHIRNDGTDVIYAAKTAGIMAGADGVTSIPAGQAATVRGISGAVYLLGTGSVLIQSDDYVASPFKTSAQGGSGADEVARAAINEHSGNAEIHVTGAEKAAWNSKAEMSDIPTELPANGGNADTVGGYSAALLYKRYDGPISDANLATGLGTYTVDQGCPNVPEDERGIISVESANVDIWLKQTYTRLFPPFTQYVRIWNYAAWSDWEKVSDGGNAASVGAYTEAAIAALEARIAALESK